MPRQPPGPLPRRARAAGRLGRASQWLLRATLVLVLGTATLVLLAAAALFWRASQGPVSLDWLIHQAQARLGGRVVPAGLQIGHATLQWRAFEQGVGHSVELDVRDVQLAGAAAPAVVVGHANIQLSPGALMRGSAVPRAVVMDDVRLRLARDHDGKVHLDDGAPMDDLGDQAAAGSFADTLALLRQPARTDQAPPHASALHQLHSVQVHGLWIDLADRRLGANIRLDAGSMDLSRQSSGGVAGAASARLAVGDVSATLSLRAELGETGAGTRIAAALTPVSPAALSRTAPALAPLAVLDTLVELSATVILSSGLAPQTVSVRAGAGTGQVHLPDFSLSFETLALAADASWTAGQDWRRPDRLQVSQAQAVIASPGGAWPTTVTASGRAVRDATGMTAEVSATLDHVAFAELPALWPKAMGVHIRPWLTQNLTAGTARNGRLTVTVRANGDGSGAKLTAATASLLGDDVTIHWLRPVPPIEHAQAVLTLLTPDVLEISIPTARQGAGQLSKGLVRITGLSAKDQDLALSADVSAGVPELLTLLRHPRLNLLSRKPLNVQRPAGALAGTLEVTLPLEHDLAFEAVGIHAKGRLTGLRLGGLVAGRDLDRGDVAIDVTPQALHASGQAAVGNIPAAVTVDMDFRDGGPAQIVQQATAEGQATAAQLAAAGLDFTGIVGAGQAGLVASYAARRDGEATVAVKADLRNAALALAGWSKAPGQPATASASLLIRNERLQGIRELQAQGPGLEVRGRAEMVGGRPLHLILDTIHIGPTRARGEIRLPPSTQEPIRATLQGTVLDLSAQLERKPPTRPAGAREEPGTPFVADVRFDKVLLSGERSIGAVTAHAENDGRRLTVLHVQSTGREQVRLDVVPRGNGRAVTLRAADAGGLARALDVIDTVDGGTLALDGQYDDTQPDPPLSGTVTMAGFHVREAPGVGKLLQALTVYGIGEAMSGPGLSFSQLTAPFRWHGGVLTVEDARAFSASLGLTAAGRIDTRAKTVDLKGTVVPAYALNSALGRIPVIGGLFSAERGGGLVAVNYGYRGPLANPTVVVNPLSALTPGFLRGLFKIFD